MAKKNMIEREKKRRRLYEKFKLKKTKYLQELTNAETFSDKLEVQAKLQKIPRNSARVRLRNRCWKTGRGRGVYRDFGLCRHALRRLANEGYLPGVVKSSW